MRADGTGGGPAGPSGGATLPRPRIVIIGAGIAGLAAALRIVGEAPGVELAVCEAGARPGGVIGTERAGERGEYLIEAGPDSFLTEKPEALRFCGALGIEDGLVGMQPAASRSYVVYKGRLAPIPDGFRIFAPTRVWPWLRSPLFSRSGKVRAAMDWVLPRGRPRADETVASFVQRRLGREVFDRIAEPMIGTIYTGDATRLSLAATMPRFVELERRYGSVIRGLLHARAAMPARAIGTRAGGPPESARRLGIFAAHANGMQALVDAAAGRLPPGVLRLRTPVVSVGHGPGGQRYCLPLSGGGRLDAEAVVIATAAPAAARLLEDLDAGLAAGLNAIPYASSASVSLAYRRGEIRPPLDGFGFVVPRVERRPILAASFSSVKFAGRAPADRALLRVFLGGALAPAMIDRDDEDLVATVGGEMEALLGAAAPPVFSRVHRHRNAMPQYAAGHLARLAEIEARVAVHAGLAVAGAAYRGVGISDCIRSGEAAADLVLTHVGSRGLVAAGVRP